MERNIMIRIEPLFKDRKHAGRVLARDLRQYSGRADVIVLALPRGGVPVAFEVARALNAPLDIFAVRKLGVPGQPELAFGAIASGGTMVLNEDLVKALGLSDSTMNAIAEQERVELERRESLYRGARPRLNVRSKTVIIIDDGLATGATMRAAVSALQKQHPYRIIVAVPVASREACDSFRHGVDVMAVCAVTPEPFYGVGMWYANFSQTSDEEVQMLLARSCADTDKRAAINN
jgi:putative phosphoribosyl transferase